MDDLVISVCRVRSLVFPGMPFAVVGRFMESPATAAVALLATGIGWTVMAIYPVVAQSLARRAGRRQWCRLGIRCNV